MTSRPLRIAFTALTLSLAVSLSLWVLHASYEQREFSQAVALRMPSAPAEINSHEVRETLSSSLSASEPFADVEPPPQMVELEEPPELIGIEAAPVSQGSSSEQAPPPIPFGDEIEDMPELSLESPFQDQPTVDEPLELPELGIEEPSNEESFEFPQLDPTGPEPQNTEPQPEPPLVELNAEPLSAPRPPAWLSAQATLEAEIRELRQQQKTLEEALSDRRQEAEDWRERERAWRQQQQAWNDEKKVFVEQLLRAQKETADARKQLAKSDEQIAATRKLLEHSKQEAADLQQQIRQLDALLEESHSVNGELKSTLKEKLSLISRLENDARKTKNEMEKLRKSRRADRVVPQDDASREDTSIQDVIPSKAGAPALLPPLPDQTYIPLNSDVVEERPIVPRLAGRSDPPPESEPAQTAPAAERRQPLIPAAVESGQTGYCSQCGATLEPPPREKGLIYDLEDWFDEWQFTGNSHSVCERIFTGKDQCSQAGDCAEEKKGLIPDLVNWWKHRRDRCDCGCH